MRRALAALFGGTVGKDTVSRTWRKVKSDWDAWNSRSLAGDTIVRLILDGTVVRVRLDRKATSISLLVILGVRADGQKVLLAIKSMGGETLHLSTRSFCSDNRNQLYYVAFNLAAPKTQQRPALADQPGLRRLQVINTLVRLSLAPNKPAREAYGTLV